MEFLTSIVANFISSLAYDKFKNLALNKDDKYLNYSPAFNLAKYSNSHPIAASIPYLELLNFNEIKKRIALQIHEGDFYTSALNSIWKEISQEGFQSLKNEDRIGENEPAIRLFNVEILEDEIILHLERTFYHEQAKSNLILDFKSRSYSSTIRDILLQEYYNDLPPLDNKSLANNVGIATLVFYQQDAIWIPYMVRRKEKVGVFPGGLHCTASGVAKWPRATAENTVSDFFDKHMLSELKEEVGLEEKDLFDFKLISLCREFARGGKPQLFYAAKTQLKLEELILKRKAANKVIRQANLRNEINDRWYLPEKIYNSEELLSDLKKYNVTLEGIASLFYGAQYLKGL